MMLKRGAFDSHLAELIMAGREIFRLEQIESLARAVLQNGWVLLTKSKYTEVFRISYESLSLTTMTRRYAVL